MHSKRWDRTLVPHIASLLEVRPLYKVNSSPCCMSAWKEDSCMHIPAPATARLSTPCHNAHIMGCGNHPRAESISVTENRSWNVLRYRTMNTMVVRIQLTHFDFSSRIFVSPPVAACPPPLLCLYKRGRSSRHTQHSHQIQTTSNALSTRLHSFVLPLKSSPSYMHRWMGQ
jgi:hypothetical protein